VLKIHVSQKITVALVRSTRVCYLGNPPW